jgi:hypothetical protein
MSLLTMSCDMKFCNANWEWINRVSFGPSRSSDLDLDLVAVVPSLDAVQHQSSPLSPSTQRQYRNSQDSSPSRESAAETRFRPFDQPGHWR